MPPIPERLAAKAVFKTIGECRAAIVTIGINDDAKKMSEIFKSVGEGAEMIDLKPDSEQCSVLLKMTGKSEFPISFVKGDCVGGVKRLENYQKSGVLQEWFEQHQYDLIVLGGGSGGLAAAKQASSLGKKVACLDFVKPTPKGTTWGLGGTCVNVGCIPKKLMHHASLVGHFVEDAPKFGWQVAENAQHNWDKMKESVQNHIGSLNWGYRVQLREKEVTYLNSFATFVGSHKIKAVNKRGKEEMLTADKFILATGLRPRYIGVPGAKEYCITSDDLFSLPYCPGKTLCVGASYVSLECAGFLRGIGLDVTVMVRSILLRGFDQDMAERVGRHMETQNVKFIRGAVPTKFELLEEGTPGRIRVTSKTTDGKEIVDEYNTVVLAIGRDAVTDGMGLEVAGVERNPKNKKIVCNNEQSVSTPWVYAIGDVLDGKLELTPVAIQAGKLLAKRMFGAGTDLTDYENVPTTVFTPLEYGCCGLSEEKAIERYGESNIEVYHNVFMPLEFSVPGRVDINHCYAKLVCNKQDNMRVVGLHIIAPNAGEVTQGYGMAFKFNATKADFDDLVGIHPTVAEIFTTMAVTKREQGELKATGC